MVLIGAAAMAGGVIGAAIAGATGGTLSWILGLLAWAQGGGDASLVICPAKPACNSLSGHSVKGSYSAPSSGCTGPAPSIAALVGLRSVDVVHVHGLHQAWNHMLYIKYSSKNVTWLHRHT